MTMKPTIQRGLGALTPEVWSRLNSVIGFVETYRDAIAAMAAERSGGFDENARLFFAKITGHKEMDACGTDPNCFRWRYGWKKVKISVTEVSAKTVVVANDYAVGADGSLEGSKDNEANYSTSSPTLSTFAVNLCEIGNTTTIRSGYRTDGASGYILDGSDQALVGWYVQPIPVNTIVMMSAIRTFNGRAQYAFSMQNSIDGACPNPIYIAGGGAGEEEEGQLPL
jgi:hypothetical protein